MAISLLISLAASAIETRPFLLAPVCQFYRNELLNQPAVGARVIIKQKRKDSEGGAADCTYKFS